MVNKTAKNGYPKYNDKEYTVIQQLEDKQGRIYEKEVYKPQYRQGREKAWLKLAKTYDVSIDHAKKAYEELNGRKLDGFRVNDIMDRYGINGWAINRSDLAVKYGYRPDNISPVEIAEKKLMSIIQTEDPLKAYLGTFKEVASQLESQLKESVIYGE